MHDNGGNNPLIAYSGHLSKNPRVFHVGHSPATAKEFEEDGEWQRKPKSPISNSISDLQLN